MLTLLALHDILARANSVIVMTANNLHESTTNCSFTKMKYVHRYPVCSLLYILHIYTVTYPP